MRHMVYTGALKALPCDNFGASVTAPARSLMSSSVLRYSPQPQKLLFRVLKGGFKVSSDIWYRSSYGTDCGNSEMVNPV